MILEIEKSKNKEVVRTSCCFNSWWEEGEKQAQIKGPKPKGPSYFIETHFYSHILYFE
jgi:hypothetical protein